MIVLDYLMLFFEHIKIYDNEFIKQLLFHYRNKEDISISDFNQYISDEKYKILINDSYYQRGCGKYLLIECNREKKINSTKVEFLFEHGININEKGDFGETPLINASRSENLAIVKYLVENGTDVNDEDYNYESQIIISCEKGNEVIIKNLVEHKADVNAKSNKEKGIEEIVKYLVEHGADVNKENKKAIVKYLVGHGADVNKETKWAEISLF
ncbi:ankyrin repeat-containing domain protein [Neocallimastix sp. 'constans']